MNTTFTALIVFGCLIGAVLLGRTLRGLLPEDHLTADSRDTIKLAMGLVATMAALVLGLLVSSAKGSYDTERSEVIQMAAKVTFLGRVLAAYGPEATGVRGAASRDRRGSGFSKSGPEKCAVPAAWLRIRKQAMHAYGAIAGSLTTQRHAAQASKRRQQHWPWILLRFGHCSQHSRSPLSRSRC